MTVLEATNAETSAKQENFETQEVSKYLTFFLGEEVYGLDIHKVKEIIGLLSITAIPRTPDFIRGVINLRGKVVPVMNLRAKFEMPSREDTDETCIIVVDLSREGREVQIGILVDNVSEVLDLASSNIEPPPSLGDGINTDFIKGMGKNRENVIMILDIEHVLSGQEVNDIRRAAASAPEKKE